jgi:hypothetical protein
LAIIPGVTCGSDLLGQILCDPGDFILSPAPYYYRFMNDFGDRSLVNIQLVQPSAAVGATAGGGICSTMLSVDGFEKAYKEIVSSKVREKI